MIGKTLGHYRVGEQLGRGGMGEVYLADDLNLNRRVALKFLPDAFAADPERMARFEREAKLLASLNHPNIAAIYGLEQAEGKRFLVLELVEGETLAQRISKGALPVDEALGVCRQIAEGLEAAHEKGVIHRDLKPANVMITDGDKVKILDFGLAKALSDETQSIDSSQSPTLTEAMTRPGVILGTAAYMSPEQAKGKSVDKRADIWAFGCVLYEMLTGKRAFEGDTVTETLATILKSDPEWERIPAKARMLLKRCLEKDPRCRLRDVGDAFALLENTPENALKKHSLHWPAWTAAVIFLLIAVALALVHYREKEPPVELMRFQIPFPDKVNASTATFSISPDGRFLAFSAVGPNGVLRYWLRALNSLEVRPLAGAESLKSQQFFWSPDSHFIGFAADEKLKKIDINGGPQQTICGLKSFSGGSWNRDGVILFGTLKGLMRVPEAGGAASPVTRIDPARQEMWHGRPTFLPDGRHFLYVRSSRLNEIIGIYLGDLDVEPEKQNAQLLVSAGSEPAYVPGQGSPVGHLLFLREQTLMAQSFDEKRLELVGEPVPLAEQVGYRGLSGLFSASTNGILVHRVSTSANNLIIWTDRDGRELSRIGEPGQYPTFDLSKDATRLVVSRGGAVRWGGDLWILDLVRGSTARLTLEKGRFDSDPRWSPDGREIAFVSSSSSSKSIVKIPLGFPTPTEILDISSSRNASGLDDWSPDGAQLLYHPTEQGELWTYSLVGERKPKLVVRSLSGQVDQARFSPDGRWIAFNTNESGRYEVVVVPFPPTGDKWIVSTEGGVQPTWNSNGHELYFLALDGTLMAVDIRPGKRFEWGKAHPLFKTQLDVVSNMEQYAPAPNGKQFLLVTPTSENATAPVTVVLNWTALLKK